MESINFQSNNENSNNHQDNRLIDKVYKNLALPESTFLGTRITKKMLLESASHNGNELSSPDKKLVTEVIQTIEWQNTLKPETLNIPVYVSETVEYIEIAIIRITLKHDNKNKGKLKNTAKLLHTLIPYPVILLIELGDELAISLADKRINQADNSKLVIEYIYNTNWLSSISLTEAENSFLNDFSLKNASSLNYFELYQDFISMLIGLETSRISGHYLSKSKLSKNNVTPNSSNQNDLSTNSKDSIPFYENSNENKTALLRNLESLEAELSSIRKNIKKETQMNNKMRLNIEAKKVKLDIADIKKQLT